MKANSNSCHITGSLMDGDNPTNRLDVIAGQATPTVTKVLACDSGDSIVVAENYTRAVWG
ncbi:hypothetical protein OK016_11140 [Vibrio chagasii]|nr:hypothetical protein [Vibrio chagasii]